MSVDLRIHAGLLMKDAYSPVCKCANCKKNAVRDVTPKHIAMTIILWDGTTGERAIISTIGDQRKLAQLLADQHNAVKNSESPRAPRLIIPAGFLNS